MNSKYKINFLSLKKKILNIEKILNKNNNYLNNKYFNLYRKLNKLNKIKFYFENFYKYSKELDDLNFIKYEKDMFDLIKEEKNNLKKKVEWFKTKIDKFYLLTNKNDNLNVYLEIHCGTGGNESSLFVADLFRMYVKFSEKMKWKVELLNLNSSCLNGYKNIMIKITGNNVYKNLKFESGGHRVQRIPKTESKGRIHTSTCIVAVIPVVSNIKLPLINNDQLKIDTFRSSGAGGQHVNTTDSAVRITHIPTGIVVECQQERSQYKNKCKALEVLKSRIYNLEMSKRNKEKNITKKKLLGTGLRCDRNRTYNFTQNRVTDHRINLNIYFLSEILNGKLDLLINPLLKYYNG